jgi:hypothetical protein
VNVRSRDIEDLCWEVSRRFDNGWKLRSYYGVIGVGMI